MGLFSGKRKDGSIRTTLQFVDGIDNFSNGELVELSYHETENEIRIKSGAVKDKPVVHLSLDKIVNADVIREKDIIEKQKSVAGRAAVGGLILGPLGAIVGGMSGIGSKKKTKVKYYMVINYKKDGEIKVLSFEIIDGSLYWDKILDAIKERVGPAPAGIEL